MNLRLTFLTTVSLSGLLFSIPSVSLLIGFTSFTYVFMQKNQDKLHSCEGVGVDAFPANGLVHFDAVPYRLKQDYEQVDRVDEDEGQEVLVVAISEAVVHEWAVVVEQFHASVADCAVERGLALDHLTARAKVIQVQSNLQSHFNQFREVVVRPQVAWLQKHSQDKQRHTHDEQANRSVDQRCMGTL